MAADDAEQMTPHTEALHRLATALCVLCNRVIDFDPEYMWSVPSYARYPVGGAVKMTVEVFEECVTRCAGNDLGLAIIDGACRAPTGGAGGLEVSRPLPALSCFVYPNDLEGLVNAPPVAERRVPEFPFPNHPRHKKAT